MGEFHIKEIDDVIHGRIRLGVMAYLIGAERAPFKTIGAALDTTDGNLSVHLRKLESAGFITLEKSFVGKKPLTEVLITAEGRRAFARYLDAMAKLARA